MFPSNVSPPRNEQQEPVDVGVRGVGASTADSGYLNPTYLFASTLLTSLFISHKLRPKDIEGRCCAKSSRFWRFGLDSDGRESRTEGNDEGHKAAGQLAVRHKLLIRGGLTVLELTLIGRDDALLFFDVLDLARSAWEQSTALTAPATAAGRAYSSTLYGLVFPVHHSGSYTAQRKVRTPAPVFCPGLAEAANRSSLPMFSFFNQDLVPVHGYVPYACTRSSSPPQLDTVDKDPDASAVREMRD
ncbi:hypothetical protein C8R43DRAFT_964085 [Mycena crocata]|nr:hypothetical protein C8R43DRAFT_964085 [Mycena crocata]